MNYSNKCVFNICFRLNRIIIIYYHPSRRTYIRIIGWRCIVNFELNLNDRDGKKLKKTKDHDENSVNLWNTWATTCVQHVQALAHHNIRTLCAVCLFIRSLVCSLAWFVLSVCERSAFSYFAKCFVPHSRDNSNTHLHRDRHTHTHLHTGARVFSGRFQYGSVSVMGANVANDHWTLPRKILIASHGHDHKR